MTDELLPVTDADKSMAAEIAHAVGMDCDAFTGEQGLALVQLLARHRADATAPLVEALITDAAVEAAAIAHCDRYGGEGWWCSGLTEHNRDEYRDAMRAALTAALAPYKAATHAL